MTAIKICGLSEPATLDTALAAGATHVGFVFFPPSPRNVTPDRAASLAGRVPSQVKRVGVFVDPDDNLLETAIRAGRLDAVQLHGEEPPERLLHVKRRFGVQVWKAAPVRTRADIMDALAYRGAADLLLFDAKPPKSANLPGGNGIRFDWRLLEGMAIGMPWGLSGGLDPATVADAIGVTGAPLVDVSSGVEDAPGVKSPDKIKAFCKAVLER